MTSPNYRQFLSREVQYSYKIQLIFKIKQQMLWNIICNWKILLLGMSMRVKCDSVISEITKSQPTQNSRNEQNVQMCH